MQPIKVVALLFVVPTVLACNTVPDQTSTPALLPTKIFDPTVTEFPVTEAPPTLLNGPVVSNCPLLPSNNILNARVDTFPLHPQSDDWIDSIGRDESFHMD